MKIQIDENHLITSDSMNYILQERKERKEPVSDDLEDKYYLVNVGYYSTITNALQGYKELQIRNSDTATINELMNLIKKLDKKIETLLGGN